MVETIDLGVCKVRPRYSDFVNKYHILNADSTLRGVVRADVRSLLKESVFYEFFAAKGLAEFDNICFLYNFWPNGVPTYYKERNPELEPLMRQGVGSAVLEFVLKDHADRFDIRMVYADSNNANPVYMVDFFKKHGFDKIVFDGGQGYFYKILQQGKKI